MSYAEIEAEIKKALHITNPENMQCNLANGCSSVSSGQQSKKEIASQNRKPAENFPPKPINLNQRYEQIEGSRNFSGGGVHVWQQPVTGGGNTDVSPRKRNRRKKKNDFGQNDVQEHHSLNPNNSRNQDGNAAASEHVFAISCQSVVEPIVREQAQMPHSRFGVNQELPFSVMPSAKNCNVLESLVVTSNRQEHDYKLKPEYRETENVVAGECSGSVSSHSVGEAVFKTNERVLSSVSSIKPEYPFGLASSYDTAKPAKFSVVRGNEAATAKSTKRDKAVAPVSEEKPDFAHQIPVERRQSQSEMCRQESGEEPTMRLEDKKDRPMRALGSVEMKASSEQKTNVASSKKQDSQTPASNEKIEKELEANYIFPLKKKSTKFTNAKYFCRLCEYHCDSVSHCQQHMKNARHERLLSVLLEENFLRDMVSPSPAHGQAVTQAINHLLMTLTPTESQQRERFIIFLKIEELVKQISKDAVAAVYGSTVSLTALRDSDLNIDVNDANPARLLMKIYQILKDDQSGYFRDVRSDFQSKFPAVYATVSTLNLRVQIGVNNGQSVLTSRLLSVYFQLDKRARPLAIAFRHWAKMCRIDCQAEGTLPAYVFGLMTVYFLQQCSPPVLPVLHELFAEQIRDSGGNIGCILHLENVREKWKSSSTASDVGKLWIEMLRFYCLELNTMDAVVCVRESRLVKRAEKKWTSKKLAIEDPCICKRNVARSLSHSQIYEYIDEQLRHAYKYFGIVQDNGFAFDDVKLIPKKGPGVICSICQREGHLKTNCPEDTLPPLPRLPTLNRQYINILNKVLHQIFDDCRPRDRELKQRRSLLDELHSVVQSKYPDAKLCLFGSSCNGFGFQNSDLDISLTFADHKTAENLNCVEIIETLTKKLKQHRGFYNVFAITTAKVPIVKFKHSRSQLEGDISLYNTLAQHNTRMLQTYADIDIRVRILGYSMKVLAKSCDICDASRGSLSSYAYTLMVIYYLQQRKNPIVPVLQELYRGGRRPETIVDGWNAWFFEDLKNLTKFWNGKNQESVAELWIGLLRFYTEEFNIREMVISIRQREPLTKFEKLWNGSGIAIEDPFNLDHNLGSALSRKMNVYILKVLRSARYIHGTPVNRLDPRYMTMADYLFDAYVLIDAPPPNDRGCRRCGKIGHFVNECPLLNRKSKQPDIDPDEEEDDPSKETVDAKDIPTLIATKEPLKISKTDSMKPSSVSSTDSLGNQHPSGVDVLSTPASSSNSGRLDDGSSGSSGNLRTEPQSPLLSSALVFHNSNFSPSSAAVTPMEVFGSQVHGGSYLVPTMFQPLVPFIQQPAAAMAMPNPLMSQWVAATMSANQVDQQSLNLGTSMTPNFPGMTGQLPNTIPLLGSSAPASSTINVPTKPGQTQQISPLMSLPLSLMNLPLYPSPGGNQGNMTLENFSQLALNANRQTSAGVEGHPLYIGQQSQGQKKSQVEHGSVGQAQLLLPLQMENKVPGQSLQTDLLNKVQGQQVQRQGHAQGYPMQSQLKDRQVQSQFQRMTIPGATDAKLQSHLQGQPAEAHGPLAMGNLRAPTSKTDQRAGMLKSSHDSPQLLNPLNYNQFSFPVGAIDRPSVHPSSAFTAMMAHHYQQQYQHQCYQDILQASLLQALGINNSGTSANVVPVQSVDSAAASVNSPFSISPAVSGDSSCGFERSADQLSRIEGSPLVATSKLDKAQKEPGIK